MIIELTDRKLLELAAKAAGIDVWFPRMNGGKNPDGTRVVLEPCHTETDGITREWNPLIDDGDALRLAIQLGIDIAFLTGEFFVTAGKEKKIRRYAEANADMSEKTRNAIVNAAAEIGRGMP